MVNNSEKKTYLFTTRYYKKIPIILGKVLGTQKKLAVQTIVMSVGSRKVIGIMIYHLYLATITLSNIDVFVNELFYVLLFCTISDLFAISYNIMRYPRV